MWRNFVFKSLFQSLIIATLSMAACVAIEPDKSVPLDSLEGLFPHDSRRWSQHESAVVLSDFSNAVPAAALTTGRREKEKWKILPFETADLKGSAISTYAFTDAPTVSLKLGAHGWHAIYLGVSTVSAGSREAKNGLQRS